MWGYSGGRTAAEQWDLTEQLFPGGAAWRARRLERPSAWRERGRPSHLRYHRGQFRRPAAQRRLWEYRALSCSRAWRAVPDSSPPESAGRSRSEEHTSELQSLMRISYAVFCLKKKKHDHDHSKL